MRCSSCSLLIPAIALAEPVLPPQPPPAQAVPAHAADCDAWYSAAQAQANYRSLLNVHIAPDGMVRDAALAVTSGNADIDNAALACAPHLFLRFNLMDGQTGDIAWQIQIFWRGGRSFYVVPNSNADSSACIFPPAARRERRTGESTVSYVIESDGSVTGATLVQSSGWKDFDDTSVACASTRHYAPLTAGGKPARVQWTAAFNWHLKS